MTRSTDAVAASQDPQEDEWPDEPKLGALRTLIAYHELIRSLTFRDIRARYKQSILGVAWALIQPLALTIVYTVVFSVIVRVETGGIPYPIFSYIALLPWTFFSGALTTSTESLVANFNLVTKIYFPRETFPIAGILGKMVDLGLGVLVLVPLFIVYHIHLTWWLLIAPVVLLVQICLLLGLAFLLSGINVIYRDIRHVLPLVLQVWMYLTPIIYRLEDVPKQYLSIYMLNPMVSVMDSFRKVALMGRPPDWLHLGISAAVAVAVLVFGYRVFKRLEPVFAELI